jgi:hypothetical protein
MFCSRCGDEMDAGAKFCSRCGVSIGSVAALPVAARPPFPPQVPVVMPPPFPTQRPLAQPPLVFESQTQRSYVPQRKQGNPAAVAAWLLLAFACAGSLIPGLGFGMWLIVGPILLITLVLGIVAISRGSAVNGVMIILMSLIVVPLFVVVAPFVGTGVALGAFNSPDAATNAPSTSATPFADLDTLQNAMPALEDSNSTSKALLSGNDQAFGDTHQQTSPEPNPVQPNERAPILHAAQDFLDDRSSIAPDTTRANAPTRLDSEITARVRYAVLRTRPSTFSKGLGRLEPGTPVQAGDRMINDDWMSVTTADGKKGYLKADQVETRAR